MLTRGKCPVTTRTKGKKTHEFTRTCKALGHLLRETISGVQKDSAEG